LVAHAAAESARFVGMPEAVLPLTQACVYLSLACKSNTVIKAYMAARKDIRQFGPLEVPLEIRNAVTKLMQQVGYGAGYRYPHDLDGHVDPEHESHLPEILRKHLPERRYVHSGPQGWEAKAEARIAAVLAGEHDEPE
jgi:putative ATPase